MMMNSEPAFDRRRYRGGGKAVTIVQCRKRTGGEKLVGQRDLPESRMDARAHQQRCNRLTQATDLAVVLGDDNQTTGLARFAEDRFYVERLDSGNMQHRCLHAIICE